MTIGVVIPTKNAAHQLPAALESVDWADEIVVVDMFSEDGTDEVCATFPQCRLVQRSDYIFGNVNHGLDLLTTDWAMRLDSDERIPPELAEELRALVRDAPPEVTGYEFRERLFVLGRELRHGFGSPHYRKMLFRRGAARYPVQREHEELETSGTWLRAQHGYAHYNYTSFRQYFDKTDYYTDRDVERAGASERPRTIDAVLWPLRQFLLNYVRRRGYRDGWVGLLDAGMRAHYLFVLWSKLRKRLAP
jgi:glycosyltransferase involved in cell wall biosynthesis